MDRRIPELKEEWGERAKRLGKSRRSVLFKRFPAWLNSRIHRKHRDFVLGNLPDTVSDMLDVGCGYGRISREVRAINSNANIHGVELCEEFAVAFGEEFDECFNGSIQEFQSTKCYDAIVIVTVLMYLRKEELGTIVEKYWSMLSPGGVMICIEPAIEILETWRRLTGKPFASPTGGSVFHFQKNDLKCLFTTLEKSTIIADMSVPLFPGAKFLSLHHGFAVAKRR
ncbi:MAG: class I SAM-dependent methyltransferase [Gammaproteobacteria bacterium]|nr:class I SAM-dependent methyltransferase [Gammaproteobacteria bacterium]